MTTPNHGPATGPHPNHDRLLISAHVAGDLAGRELASADALLAGCEDCRILHADLLALAAAAHDLPAPALAGARDFRIGPERAAELTRGGPWRRLLRPFGRRGGASRPLAMAFTTLGVAGLLLAALPTMQLPTGDALRANAPEATDGRNALQATADPQATAQPDAESPGKDTSGGAEYEPTGVDLGASQVPGAGAGAGAGSGAGGGPSAVPTGEEVVPSGPEIAAIEENPSGPSLLVLLSVAFLAAGLGLLLLRVTAVRLR